MIKRYFITGLIILLPLALTLWVFSILITLLTTPFEGAVQLLLSHSGVLEQIPIISSPPVQLIVSKIVILIFLILFTILLGGLARWFFFRFLIKKWDSVIHRIPLIRTVYKTSQDIIHTLFKNKTSFKQVVIVPFPHKNAFTLGLVTKETMELIPGKEDKDLIGVFIPTTPNPTSGYVVLYEKKEIIPTEMTVEEAFKFIVSCGIMSPKIFGMKR